MTTLTTAKSVNVYAIPYFIALLLLLVFKNIYEALQRAMASRSKDNFL